MNSRISPKRSGAVIESGFFVRNYPHGARMASGVEIVFECDEGANL